jgi:hypothetical protein
VIFIFKKTSEKLAGSEKVRIFAPVKQMAA